MQLVCVTAFSLSFFFLKSSPEPEIPSCRLRGSRSRAEQLARVSDGRMGRGVRKVPFR